MDYSAPHQLVVEAQQGRAKVAATGLSAVPTRLTVRGVSNNNQHLLSQDNKDIQPYGESFDEARCDLM